MATESTPKTVSRSRIDHRALLYASTTVILWASAFAGIRAALVSYSPQSIALLRYLIASVVMAVFALLTRMPLPELSDLPGIAMTGILGYTIYNIALTAGEVQVPAGVASFIVASVPIFLALLSIPLYKEKLAGWGWLGIVVSFVGVATINLATQDGFRFDPGALLILLAAIAQTLYSLGQRPYLKKYGSLRFVTYAIWAGTLFLLPFLPGLLRDIKDADYQATLAVVYMGVFPGAIGYLSWSSVLSRLPASIAGSFLYMVPAFAVVIAWLWLGEVPTVLTLLGGALTVAGVILVNTKGRKT